MLADQEAEGPAWLVQDGLPFEVGRRGLGHGLLRQGRRQGEDGGGVLRRLEEFGDELSLEEP